MTRISITGICFTVIAGIAAAQDKVTVPLSSPSQPATVKAHLISGSITVTAGAGSQVVIESAAEAEKGTRPACPRRPRRQPDNVPPGMHRIDAGGRGFSVEEDHNVVTVIPDIGGQFMNLTLQVPVNTSVELKTSMAAISTSPGSTAISTSRTPMAPSR